MRERRRSSQERYHRRVRMMVFKFCCICLARRLFGCFVGGDCEFLVANQMFPWYSSRPIGSAFRDALQSDAGT